MASRTNKKSENKLNLESILFNCRDYLRSNATLNDKRDLLLTLVFLRFIGEKFDDAQTVMRQECIDNGITDETMIEAFLMINAGPLLRKSRNLLTCNPHLPIGLTIPMSVQTSIQNCSSACTRTAIHHSTTTKCLSKF